MDLNTLWFILIAVLFSGYFILEGFDLGVGMLHPFIAKTDGERRMVINTIGPHWDANEVWLITAGGAMFAAFPNWYATLFSGFYLPLFLMLVGLILRGIALEFRSKDENPRWRALWDWAIFAGSLIPSLLWGVAFANFLRGVPVDSAQNYMGGFWNLLNPFALVGGLLVIAGFLLQGCIFLTLKTEGPVLDRAKSLLFKLWIPAIVLLTAEIGYSFLETDMAVKEGIKLGLIPFVTVLTLLAVGYLLYIKRYGWSFILQSVTILLLTAIVFLGLYPRVLISSLKPEWSLTIYNASSSPYTLQIMSIVALIFVPIVLVYQAWTYRVFRKRVSSDPKKLIY
jgi:cytochrome bd ubiquinol oxidase subunit II